MQIRKMKMEDESEILEMMKVFYASDAVLHKAPEEILKQDIKDCVGECPLIEGYTFWVDEDIAGYSMVAKSYSTEYGGLCLWVEDLYLKEAYRGLGIGKIFFQFLEAVYEGKAVRYRLEVEEENVAAVKLYQKSGYAKLPYIQMTKEV